MRYALLSMMLLGSSAAWAQQPGEPKPAQDNATAPVAAKPFAARKTACRESGGTQGLRGADLADHIQLCVEEAKLGCLKQAIAQKVPRPERRTYIQTCADKI